MHLMVDADTKQVLAVSVTSEAVGDSTELPTLLEAAARSIKNEEQQDCPGSADTVKIPRMLADGRSPLDILGTGEDQNTPDKILLADGGYGSRKNVAECHKRGVRPLIRLLTSCNARGKGSGDKWPAGAMAARGRIQGAGGQPVKGGEAGEPAVPEEHGRLWQ